MDCLSLRVSNVKTSTNLKKNFKTRISNITLPRKYVDIANSENQVTVEDDHLRNFLKLFGSASTIEIQLDSIKQFSAPLNDSCTTVNIKEIIRCLSDLYFISPLNHPLKHIIKKVFLKNTTHSDIIVECLSCIMVEEMNRVFLMAEINIDDTNKLISSFNACFENFTIAILAVKQCIKQLLPVLHKSLLLYEVELQTLQSPARQRELFIYLHESLKTIITCIHQTQFSEEIIKLHSHIANITKICWSFISNNENVQYIVPMDTKLNCGIIIVSEMNLSDKLMEFIAELINGKFKTDVIKNLCLTLGFVSLFTTEDNFHKLNNELSLLHDITNNLIDMSNTNCMDPIIILNVHRGFLQIVKKILLFKKPLECHKPNDFKLLQNIFMNFVNFISTYAEYYLESTRYLCKDLLRNLLKLSIKFPIYETILELVFDQCNYVSETVKIFYYEQICQVLGTETIYQRIINLDKIIFEKLLIFSVHNNEFDDDLHYCYQKCFEKLMISNLNEISLNAWYERWLQPIISNRDGKIITNTIEILKGKINSILKMQPKLMAYILEEKFIALEIYVFIMWTITRNGLTNHLKFESNSLVKYYSIMNTAMYHTNDDVRIMCLKIIAEVHKTAQPFEASDFEYVLTFLKYNCNCQNASMRQQIITLMLKIFARLEHGLLKFNSNTNNSLNIFKIYIKFVNNLKQFSIDNLYDGANLSRRTLSLTFLLEIIRITSKLNLSKFISIWTEKLHKKLVTLLCKDTMELNKNLINKIIIYCPNNLIHSNTIMFNLDNLKKLVMSVKPQDSITAAYLLEYTSITKLNFHTLYDAILWCETELEIGYKLANRSLLAAARLNPLYGLLYCIRHLLQKLTINLTESDMLIKWQIFFKRLIQLCQRLSDLVLPVVNNASPEGYLPNEINDVAENPSSDVNERIIELQHTEDQDFSTEINQLETTPQMMLLCAWRTIKEISLLLSDFTLKNTSELITSDDILNIGKYFHQLLSQAKHRGVFEQAYVGFSKLAIYLWRSKDALLNNLPMVWLKELLNIISLNSSITNDDEENSQTLGKICATRRSAGIPFMIQAITISELEVHSTQSLKFCMKTLLNLCKNGLITASRVHSLNILRAIFRCSSLGDYIGEYVADAVECSLNSYSADTFAERNSATLLFASLITRIFGVQRTKDSENLNIRNKMTGRIFFLRYPQLYDYFLMVLESSTNSILNDERPIKLLPLLLLFSRLYPSALEGCSSNLLLLKFIPYLEICSQSPDYKTRVLAIKSAIALNALATVDDLTTVYDKFKTNMLNKKCNSNAVHGNLLHIKYLVEGLNFKHIVNSCQFAMFLKQFVSLNLLQHNNLILLNCYLDIVIDLICRSQENQQQFIIDEKYKKIELIDDLIENLSNTKTMFPIGETQTLRSLIILNLFITIKKRQTDRMVLLFENLGQQKSDEYIKIILNILLLILSKNHSDDYNDIINEYECNDNEIKVVNHLSTEEVDYILKQFSINCKIAFLAKDLESIINKVDQKCFELLNNRAKSLLILSYLTDYKFKLNINLNDLFLELETNIPCQLKCAILAFINSYINEYDSGIYKKYISIINFVTQPHNAYELRFIGAKCLLNVTRLLRNDDFKIDVDLLIQIANIILGLLHDNNASIREFISKLIISLGGNSTFEHLGTVISTMALELFLEWLDKRVHEISNTNAWQFWFELIKLQLSVETDDRCNNENDINDSLNVFDKYEGNSFYDVIGICRNCYWKMKENMNHSNGNVLSCTVNHEINLILIKIDIERYIE